MSRSAYNESYPEPDGRSGTHVPITREGATPQAPSSSDHVVKDFTRKLAEEDGRGGRI